MMYENDEIVFMTRPGEIAGIQRHRERVEAGLVTNQVRPCKGQHPYSRANPIPAFRSTLLHSPE